MAASVSSHMPSGLPSPTLTNPDMILPFDSPSPGSSPFTLRRPQRMPSPPPIDIANPNETNGTNDPDDMRSVMRNFFRDGDRNKLRKARVPEGVSPDGGKGRKDNGAIPNGIKGFSVLASSPDDAAVPTAGPAMTGEGEKSQWHKFSGTCDGDATTPLSEGSQEGILDMGRPTYGFPPLDNEKDGFTAPPDVEDDDPYSHAAMSIRAEQILANAKKRLTNMEGNLNRARSTLHSRPSSSMSSFNNRDNEAVSMYSLPKANTSPSKHRQATTPPSAGSNKGHARVFSETAVPSTLHTPSSKRQGNGELAPRSSSAMGSTSQERSRSENPDNPKSWFWTGLTRSASQPHKHNYSLPALDEDGPAPASWEPHATNSRISEEKEEPREEAVELYGDQNSLDIETPSPSVHTLTRARSTTQMRDLRDQMQDLKGKISSLKQRAREDSLRRRSLQSLRTPSPFTAAEQWYSNSAPIAQTEFAAKSASHSRSPAKSPDPRDPDGLAIAEEGGPPADIKSDLRLSPEAEDEIDESSFDHTQRNNRAMQVDRTTTGSPEKQIQSDRSAPDTPRDTVYSNGDPPSSPVMDTEEDSLYGDHDYHETSPSPIGERHEDRPDAFDYEHFFLHSGTGTLARKDHSRSSSRSSIYSVETTKPSNSYDQSTTEDESEESSSTVETTPKRAPPSSQQKGHHGRNDSVGSISTVATFATATEGHGSDGEASEDEWILHHPIAGAWQPEQNKRKHARNGAPDSKRHVAAKSVPSTDTEPVPTVPSPYRRPSLRKQSDLLLLLEANLPPNDDGSRATLKIGDADKNLVEKLIKSLASVCTRLQAVEAEGSSYEGRVWRRRLNSATRILDGEVNGEFF